MRILFIFLISLVSIGVFAQSKFSKYSWSTFPINGKPDTVKPVNGVSILLERRILEVVTNQEDQFEEIVVLHKKLKLDSHTAIDNYNKIYIPINNVIDIISIKARFFSPTGRITELKQESIRQIDNLDNKGDYKTFAIEGAELGGQLEYFYILKRKFNPYATVYMQDDVPRSNVMSLFVYPSKLEYIAKSYNGFPSFIEEQKANDITFLKASIDYIPAISKELYSDYKAQMMRYEYTLSYNRYNSSLRIYSWSKACKNLYDNSFTIDKKEKSAVASLLKKIAAPENPAEAKIRGIENWVKSQIAISEEITYTQNLNEVIKNKQCSKSNAIKLFVALFREAGIPFELVMTGNNEDQPFDPDFNGFNFIQTQLLYFPQIEKYMVPDDPGYRLGPLPENVQGSWALFTHPIELNEELGSLGYEMGKIPVESPVANTDSIIQDLSIDMQSNLLHANSRRVFTGMNATTFQSFWHLIDNERKNEIIGSVFNMGKQNTEVEKYEITNSNPEDIGVNPLIWDLKLTASSLVETAGNDIIVRIGETIGEQSELYQETERKLPINVGILRNYYRRISFAIPEGYTVTNAADLNMEVKMMNGDKVGCMFMSTASIEGNRLIIISKEFYNDPYYPLERYEEFRKVINAAADFNKKTLLLSAK